MSSTADPIVVQSELSDASELWASGELLPNHPRVRTAWVDSRRVVVHMHPGGLPQGIRTVASDPGLVQISGLRHAEDRLHVTDFIKGSGLDSLTSMSEHVTSLVAAMLTVWDRPVGRAQPARRELPVLAPISRTQYTEMPDAVLAAASEHESAAAQSLARLSARGRGHAVIHGDLKADNVVVTDACADSPIRFIDWETCGIGHAEDDIASLLASVCVYSLGRAVRQASLTEESGHHDEALDAHVARALGSARSFSAMLLDHVHESAPHVSTEYVGSAFLVSALCRLQGLLFVPTSEALKLVVAAFVRRSMERGPDAVRSWLSGRESTLESRTA